MLPLILAEELPEDDHKWQNLVRLFQITHMIVSYCISVDLLGKLEQAIYIAMPELVRRR